VLLELLELLKPLLVLLLLDELHVELLLHCVLYSTANTQESASSGGPSRRRAVGDRVLH